MPGCANGNCTNPETMESEPFKCYCQDGWKGALCDQRKYKFKLAIKTLPNQVVDEEEVLCFQPLVMSTATTKGSV